MARYHSLRVWKLALEIVKQTHLDIKSLRGEADLRDQMKRASKSVVANICEGAERRTDKEYRHFLSIARGSASELMAWYEMLEAIGHITSERLLVMTDLIDHVLKSLSRFIQRLE